jgi:hypothetical protein
MNVQKFARGGVLVVDHVWSAWGEIPSAGLRKDVIRRCISDACGVWPSGWECECLCR